MSTVLWARLFATFALTFGWVPCDLAEEARKPAVVESLIKQLGSEKYAEREAAETTLLADTSAESWEALRHAAKDADPEVRQRGLNILTKKLQPMLSDLVNQMHRRRYVITTRYGAIEASLSRQVAIAKENAAQAVAGEKKFKAEQILNNVVIQQKKEADLYVLECKALDEVERKIKDSKPDGPMDFAGDLPFAWIAYPLPFEQRLKLKVPSDLKQTTLNELSCVLSCDTRVFFNTGPIPKEVQERVFDFQAAEPTAEKAAQVICKRLGLDFYIDAKRGSVVFRPGSGGRGSDKNEQKEKE